jgi:hypothetical protein
MRQRGHLAYLQHEMISLPWGEMLAQRGGEGGGSARLKFGVGQLVNRRSSFQSAAPVQPV